VAITAAGVIKVSLLSCVTAHGSASACIDLMHASSANQVENVAFALSIWTCMSLL